jgi:hypothetical protein
MPNFLDSTHRTITWLKQTHDAGNLELKPPFQRKPVWADSQKSYLIDTVLHGYPIPELYLQDEVDDRGREKHIVVDGQQRVRACLEFLEGKFAMDGTDSPAWADMKFDDMSSDDKKKIYGYKFVVRNIPVLEEEALRGIFKRLNRNVVALTAQELRHATYWGHFIKLMEKIADFEYWEGSGIFTANNIRRMADVEFISELAVAVLHGLQNKKVNLDNTYKLYEREFEAASRVEDIFNKTLGELSQIIPTIKDTRWRKKSDFYTLFLVFASRGQQLPLTQEKRTKASVLLLEFGERVNMAVTLRTDPKQRRKLPKEVIKYAEAVERSASDLGSRKTRSGAVEKVLKNTLLPPGSLFAGI